jgi:hypothetical protein
LRLFDTLSSDGNSRTTNQSPGRPFRLLQTESHRGFRLAGVIARRYDEFPFTSPPRSSNEITLSTHSMPASVLVSSLVEQQQTHARSECDAETPLAIHAADATPWKENGDIITLIEFLLEYDPAGTPSRPGRGEPPQRWPWP